MKKSTSIILYTILTICVILACYVIAGIGVFYRPVSTTRYGYSKVEQEECKDFFANQIDYELRTLTNEEYRHLLSIDLESFYFYSEKPMRMAGVTHPLIRLISMNEDLEYEEYCIALAHEMHHLKLFSGNERFVCQETFKYLYENEDENLKQVGIYYGYGLMKGWWVGEYDIRDFVINYLKENVWKK